MKKKKRSKTFIRFSDYDYTAIEDAVSMETAGTVVKILTDNLSLHEPTFDKKFNNDNYRLRATATLSDGDGNNINTSEFGKKIYEELRGYCKEGLPIEILAEVIKAKTKKEYIINHLKIKKCRKGNSPFQLIQGNHKEKVLVKKFLSNIPKGPGREWTLFEAIKEAIIEEFGIIGVEIDDIYNDALDAIICQAFSGGVVNNTNGKINTCIVGPPSSGKKLLWLAAQFINIVNKEAQAIRVTQAGLAAAMNKKKLTLGAIPLANQGVFGMQDFDKCKIKDEVFSIFGDVMEDGKCVITGMRKATLVAETAIHIDINRFSDLVFDPTTSRNVTEDTSLPSNIIARFDFITELKKDFELQYSKSIQLIRNSNNGEKNCKSKIAVYCKKNNIDLSRFIKLIVAYIMTEYKDIDSKSVGKYMTKKFKQISKANKKNKDKISDIAMFQMRLTNSFIKFVNASTRLQMLKKSNRLAVDKAIHLLSRKLDFLKNIDQDLIVPQFRKTGLEAFGNWLYDSIGSKKFSPSKVIRKYEKEKYPCGKIKERMLRNWIKAIAVKKEHGVWKIKKIILEKYKQN